jgi:hypothetical protein
MGIGEWISQNWFDIFTMFFGSGLWFAAFSIRKDADIRKEEVKARKVANLLAITANHREVWNKFLNNPELKRVLNPAADPIKKPVTDAEEMFVNMVMLHTNSVYYTMSDQLVVTYEGLRRDVAQFLSLPIPKAVWEKTKQFQNDDFVAFVESCRNGE